MISNEYADVLAKIDSKWVTEIIVDGEKAYTFTGVLVNYFPALAAANHWREASTIRQNVNYFNSVIIPNIELQNEKCIDEYEAGDFESAVKSIRLAGKITSEKHEAYEESTLEYFSRLIRSVFDIAYKYGLTADIFWGTGFGRKAELVNKSEKPLETVKKSFTIIQKARIYHYLLSYTEEIGERIGLSLMAILTCRCNEACGASWGDIVEIDGYPGCHALRISTTVEIGSNELKIGGKTSNTGRLIPIPPNYYLFLMKRRAMVEAALGKDIDSLPIACCGSDFKIRCRSRDLTEVSKVMFQKVGIDADTILALDEERRQANEYILIKEKSPTAYALRRIAITTLYHLGLTDSEIQYTCGHAIDSTFSRNDLGNPDLLMRIYSKMAKIILPLPTPNLKICSDDILQPTYLDGPISIGIKAGTCSLITITACQPYDTLHIKSDKPTFAKQTDFLLPATNSYFSIYKKYAATMLKAIEAVSH